MKKILVYLSNESQPSLFDIIVANDSGVDVVIPYGNVTPEDIPAMVRGCIFTRRPERLVNTAVLIGGTDSDVADEMITRAQETFFDEFRVSIMADPNGNSTTAAAAVAKIKDKMKTLEGTNAVVFAGTGPVGERVSALLAAEGAHVVLTSRNLEKAERVCEKIEMKHKKTVYPAQVSTDKECVNVLKGADIAVAAGKAGTPLVSKEVWAQCSVRVMADLNAYPPAGIEGVDARDDGREVDGKYFFGAVAIGDLKTKAMRDAVRKMYEEKGIYMDLKKIYEVTWESLAVKKERYEKGDRIK